jgi:hypothetical protein
MGSYYVWVSYLSSGLVESSNYLSGSTVIVFKFSISRLMSIRKVYLNLYLLAVC